MVVRYAHPALDDRSRRRWTEELVTRELKALHDGGLEITTRNLIDAGHHKLAHAINHFGGLRRFRRIGILPHRRKSPACTIMEREAVIEEIRCRHAAGLSVASSKISSTLQYSGRRHFGSWRRAVVAAGLNYDAIRLVRRK